MTHKITKTQDLETNEELTGTIHTSIVSSIVSLGQNGYNLKTIMHIKNHIDSLSATIWSLFCTKSAVVTGDKEAIKFNKMLKEQMLGQIENIQEVIDSIGRKVH